METDIIAMREITETTWRAVRDVISGYTPTSLLAKLESSKGDMDDELYNLICMCISYIGAKTCLEKAEEQVFNKRNE